MHLIGNEKEMNQCPSSRTIDLSASKNCSTSSTDSGVILIDNVASFRPDKKTKEAAEPHSKSKAEEKTDTRDTADATEAKRISIEHTVNITKAGGKSSSSPTVSIRSTTISVVSIDENAIDSSCIDSDSEADPEDFTVQKLGHQVTYPPNSSHLRDLNQGLTVLSRQVAIPSQSEVPPPTPLEAGVVAKQILNGNLALATPTAAGGGATQGIGSIALTNSTDVTFGDKHFYEGPVTIQQFLIDNRDKWKPGEGPGGGQDNPAFNGGTTANGNAPDRDNIGGGLVLRFVDRQVWLAQPPQKKIPDLELPVGLVIVMPTNSDNCTTQAACVFRVRLRQSYDIESVQEDDIVFNFLIGGDGNVYVGRGWDQVGAHMAGYNSRSLSLAFIGSFQTRKPSPKQLSVTRLLLEKGVALGKIAPNYRLTAASTLEPTLTTYKADALYQSFGNWTHWS
ncbi:peptidoglycan-recognition protein LC isoform X5 [Drosophila kikkawai]|uniref:Peptidoglycan-recognition protein LC isoform X5 n=1 Tax=Drosophila kikkawai TaxID=30033 RepID=A0A6P4IZL1_DROKI|nr:peptidoglycan-recognition protein LC isoform X4 [Drosophila kikkawai]